jgi:hypothetical protein
MPTGRERFTDLIAAVRAFNGERVPQASKRVGRYLFHQTFPRECETGNRRKCPTTSGHRTNGRPPPTCGWMSLPRTGGGAWFIAGRLDGATR